MSHNLLAINELYSFCIVLSGTGCNDDLLNRSIRHHVDVRKVIDFHRRLPQGGSRSGYMPVFRIAGNAKLIIDEGVLKIFKALLNKSFMRNIPKRIVLAGGRADWPIKTHVGARR